VEQIEATLYCFFLFVVWFLAFDFVLRVASKFNRGLRILYTMFAVSRSRLIELLFNHRAFAALFSGLIVTFLFGLKWIWTPLPNGYVAAATGWACGLMLIWLVTLVPALGGFPLLLTGIQPGPARYRLGILLFTRAFIFGLLCALLAFRFPGPFASIGMLAALIVFVVNYYLALGTLGKIRRAQAPTALDQAKPASPAEPIILFVSDVHVTAGGEPQSSGDPSGNINLDLLTSRLLRHPQWVLVPGDVVETGETAEWRVAIEMLQRLRMRGIRIILTPGNHDIGTAYEPLAAVNFIKHGWSDHGDTTKLAEYFEMAVLLEEKLATYDGRKLKDIWEQEIAPIRRLEGRWQQACDTALEILRQRGTSAQGEAGLAKSLPPLALRALNRSDPKKVAELIDPLIDEAIAALQTAESTPTFFSKSRWLQIFTESRYCQIHPAISAMKWWRLWLDVFPLTLIDDEQDIEFVITNSNVPEVGVLGSAFGRLTSDQVLRLRQCVSRSSRGTVIIIMHHPICRWSDDVRRPVDINRWAFLAHDSEEARQLPELLCASAPASCKQLLLCGGHVHDIARCGPLVSDGSVRNNFFKRLTILENPALPNVPSFSTGVAYQRVSALLVCERASDNSLQPALVQWESLIGPSKRAPQESSARTSDDVQVAYATATGNDYTQHEVTYRRFLTILKWAVAVVAAVLVTLAITLT